MKVRNAAWAVRNSRVGAQFNPLALRLVLTEAEALVSRGEPLWDVLEAFAELLADRDRGISALGGRMSLENDLKNAKTGVRFLAR
jgi:hypothetical protein